MTPKYHTCGHRIWLAIGWNSLDLAPVFIDDDDTSPTGDHPATHLSDA
jgi:hypothetical protein